MKMKNSRRLRTKCSASVSRLRGLARIERAACSKPAVQVAVDCTTLHVRLLGVKSESNVELQAHSSFATQGCSHVSSTGC